MQEPQTLEPAPGGAETQQCGVVTEIQLVLRDFVVRLHDAVFVLPRRAEMAMPVTSDGYCSDLLGANERMEKLIASLPPQLRTWTKEEFQEEVSRLAGEDEEVSKALTLARQEAEALLQEVETAKTDISSKLCGEGFLIKEQSSSYASQDGELKVEPYAEQLSQHADAPFAGLQPVSRARLVDRVQDRSRRFIEELEFLECLANPEYVQWLASQPYFTDPAFLAFLRYLRYWGKPPHIYHVVYPQSLRMLEMLLRPELRNRMHNGDSWAMLSQQLMWMWAWRPEEILPPLGGEPSLAPAPSESAACLQHAEPGTEGAEETKAAARAEVFRNWTGMEDGLMQQVGPEKLKAFAANADGSLQADVEAAALKYLTRVKPEEATSIFEHFKSRGLWSMPKSAGGGGDIQQSGLDAMSAGPVLPTPPPRKLEAPPGALAKLAGLVATGSRGRAAMAPPPPLSRKRSREASSTDMKDAASGAPGSAARHPAR